MVYAHLRLAPDAEGNVVHDIVHDSRNRPLNLRKRFVRPDREISARNIEADAAQRNLVFISDDATNWLRVPFVSVGTKHAAFAAGSNASFNLFQRRLVVLTENFRFGGTPSISFRKSAHLDRVRRTEHAALTPAHWCITGLSPRPVWISLPEFSADEPSTRRR